MAKVFENNLKPHKFFVSVNNSQKSSITMRAWFYRSGAMTYLKNKWEHVSLRLMSLHF